MFAGISNGIGIYFVVVSLSLCVYVYAAFKMYPNYDQLVVWIKMLWDSRYVAIRPIQTNFFCSGLVRSWILNEKTACSLSSLAENRKK